MVMVMRGEEGVVMMGCGGSGGGGCRSVNVAQHRRSAGCVCGREVFFANEAWWCSFKSHVAVLRHQEAHSQTHGSPLPQAGITGRLWLADWLLS